MTERPYWRLLAMKVAAAGPYKVVDRCHYCGGVDALASFQPGAFLAYVACCRRCRHARTGVPDSRGLIQGTASVSRPPLEALPSGEAPVIRGLIPADCEASRPPDYSEFLAWMSRPGRPAPPEILMHPRDAAEVLGITELSEHTVEEIFAPWTAADDPDLAGYDPPSPEDMSEEERTAHAAQLEEEMAQLEAELEGIFEELDRRLDQRGAP